MALDVDQLAKEINVAIGATDRDGKSIQVTPEMKAYAKGFIAALKAASTAHAPGTVTGTGGAPGPLSDGAAENGTIVGMTTGPWDVEMSAGFPSAPMGNMSEHTSKSVAYVSGAAKVNFEAGGITGVSTATPEAPGALTAGAGEGGTIDSLIGAAWAAMVMPGGGDPALTQKIYNAISKYVAENAEVSYATGTVTGTFASGGGDLIAGTAAGGTIE